MAKELIKFSNDKKGFRMLLFVEILLAVWSFAATLYAANAGRTRTMIYGGITMFAIFYILGRSLRSYRTMVRKEREEAAAGKNGEQTK